MFKKIGVVWLKFITGYYSETRRQAQLKELERIKDAVAYALNMGLKVNAGHGLNYYNVKRVAAIRGLRGLYIGHSIISRAVLIGIEEAVREMKKLIKEACMDV